MYVISDYDGVLIDSRPPVRLAVTGLFEALGLNSPSQDRIDDMLGGLIPLVMHEQITSLGIEIDAETVTEMYIDRYTQAAPELTVGFDDVIQTLEVLKANSVPVALATLKPHSEMNRFSRPLPGQLVGHALLAPASHASAPSKAQLVSDAIHELSLRFELQEPGFMIGDRASDIAAGKRAKLATVGVLWGTSQPGELESAGCDLLFDDPLEFRDYFMELLETQSS